MYEQHEIEKALKEDAARISERYDGAPVVIVVGGKAPGPKRTMTASSMGPGARMRDLLGVLQAAIQIESAKHLLGKRFE